MNRKFGNVENGILQYAPSYFKTENGVVLNPSKSEYLKRNWYEIVDTQLEQKAGYSVVLSGYSKDDSQKTLTFVYRYEELPAQVDIYSKMKLEMCLFGLGKLDAFDKFIDGTYLSNDFGQKVCLRKFYDQANDLRSNNKYFSTYLGYAKNALSVDDDSISAILSSSLMEY